jgi:hypothetical protein
MLDGMTIIDAARRFDAAIAAERARCAAIGRKGSRADRREFRDMVEEIERGDDAGRGG